MYELIISLSLQSLCVKRLATKELITCYPIVRQGKPTSPTPTGKFIIERVVKYPNWVDDYGVVYQNVNGTGSLGEYAFTTNLRTTNGRVFAIHGTTDYGNVGMGCIGLYNHHIKELKAFWIDYTLGGVITP